MKRALLVLAIVFATASASFAQQRISIDVIIGNRAPTPHERSMMSIEEAKHPNIVKSMHDLNVAMRDLNAAPDDFGGHKAQALTDLKTAWVSLRKCLYFRIYEDTH